MEQLAKLWHRIKHNSLYLIFGFYSFFAGLVLLTHRRPFYYPPQFKSIMNSPVIDGAFIVFGILIIPFKMVDKFLKKLFLKPISFIIINVRKSFTNFLKDKIEMTKNHKKTKIM